MRSLASDSMRALLLVPLLALAACDALQPFPAEGGVRAGAVGLAADADAYERGDTVELTLRNGGFRTVETGVMGCAALEQRTDAGWTSDIDYNDRACVLPLVVVEPGETYSGSLVLDGVDAGTYRFVKDTNVGVLATASFVVR